MSVDYCLASNIKYRRENFGGLVFNSATKETRFFNHAAATVIERFAIPAPVSEVYQDLRESFVSSETLSHFIRMLEGNGIIHPRTDVAKPVGATFFTDIIDFHEDHLHAPIGIEMELTLKCLRRCSYCAYESSPQVETSEELDRPTIANLLGHFSRSGIFYIRFTGGDPLTRSDALDILADADDLGFGIALASDLTAFTRAMGRRLAGLRSLTALQTTLDGPEEASADRLRGKGNFRRVMEALPVLRDLGIPMIVGMVVTKLNRDLVFQTAELLANWDVAFAISPLYDAGRAHGQRDLIPDDTDLALAYEQFGEAVRRKLVRPADPAWHIIAEPVPASSRGELWTGQPGLMRSPDRLLRIDPTGRCYTSVRLKNALANEVYIGRLPGADIFELWHSAPLLTALRTARHRKTYFGDVVDIGLFQKAREALQ